MGASTLRIATRLGKWLFVAATLVTPADAGAQKSVTSGAATPSRILVIAGQCSSNALDIDAFAEALRVELREEGVSAVDIAPSDALLPGTPGIAAIRLRLDPCGAHTARDVGVLRIEIDNGDPPWSVMSALSVTDIERPVRPRVAALIAAERFRAAWAEPSSRSPDASPNPAASAAEPAAVVVASVPAVRERRAPPDPTQAAPRPRADAVLPPGLTLAATLEWRLFSGPGAALLGPRVSVLVPGLQSIPLRAHFDVGVAFGAVHDSLGDISLTVASAGSGIAWVARAGAVRFEVGPKLELGGIAAEGVPSGDGSSVRGSTASSFFASASMLGSAWAKTAGDWTSMFAIDVGGVLAGLEARADGRPVAEVRGAMLGARVGFGRAF